MKKMLLGVLCLFLTYWPSYGQLQIPLDSPFYHFVNIFQQNNQDDGAEGGMYNQVRRDALTWFPRLGPHGKMSIANKAMIEYARAYNAQRIPTTNLIQQGGTTPINFPPNHPDAEDWDELGPTQLPIGDIDEGRGMGQIHRIAFHPDYDGVNEQRIYAGSHYGGLYYSNNNGALWQNYFTDRGGLPMTSIGGIAVSHNKVFVCTGNGDMGYPFGVNALYNSNSGIISNYNPIHTQGVYYISHGSNQWWGMNGSTTMINGSTVHTDLLTAFETGGTMRNIIVHPTEDSVVFIATSLGIFRTVNGGWQQVLIGPDTATLDMEWRGLKFHPTNPNIVYASGQNIYRSTNKGWTWTLIGTNFQNAPFNIDPARINIAVTPAAPDSLYAVLVERGKLVVVSCGNATSSSPNWSKMTEFTGTVYDAIDPSWASIAVSPTNPNKIYFAHTKVRGNAGTVFKEQSPYSGSGFHADVHEVVFPPNSDFMLFAGTHGGVNRKQTSFDGIGGWTDLDNGLGVATIWAFDDWEGNDNFIATGHQDVGSNFSIDKGNSWKQKVGGDGYGSRIDNQTGDMYILLNADEIGRYIMKPLSYNPYGFNINLPTGQILGNTFPVENHPKDESLYFGFSELYLEKNKAKKDTTYVITIYPENAILPGTGGLLSNSVNCQGFTTGPPTTYQWYQPGTPPLLPPGHCIVTTTIVNTTQTNWEKKSYLEDHQSSFWNRRILEIAFSEDDTTSYTYLATMGDNNPNTPDSSQRRSDFYVQNKEIQCDTCFDIKTANLPYDNIYAQTQDPNPITGIAVDPLNGNRVWVSFSGYSKRHKVWYSEDAGNTWQTYDDGDTSLASLNVPINHIVYQRGTKDRLYIATDVGVYVREDAENGGRWLRMSDNFPNVRTVELKINYCLGKLRAATFGRGVWEVDLLPTEEDDSYRSFRAVTGNETWSDDKNMTRDIRIDSNAVLTLDSMVLNMPKNGMIVVRPGGKLIVNASTITNLCGQTWQGIQVWGNTELVQMPQFQGVIALNGATIEYAKNAISPWEVGNFPNANNTSGGTGGLVFANKTTFRNNWRSVDFMKYANTANIFTIALVSEKSFFKECIFTVDDDYRNFGNNTGLLFLGHISMWGVGGTQIQGCTFEDVRTNKLGDQSVGGSYGIYTLDASPLITSLPLGTTFPATSFLENRFEGIERGVDIGSPGPIWKAVVDGATFLNNEQGVTIRAHSGAKVIRNTFEIGGFDAPSNTNSFVEEYGLGIVGLMSSFRVEQNTFESTNPMDETVGSWIEGTGTAGNQIRNNSYENLTAANLAHGNNDNPAIPDDGVQYLCNDNLINDLDFVVFPNLNTNGARASVGQQQGLITQANRNTLSVPAQIFPNQAQFLNWSFNTSGQLNSAVFYYYTTHPSVSASETPDISLLYNVNDQALPFVGDTAFCRDFYTSPSPQVTNQNLVVMNLNKLKNKYYKAADNYYDLVQKYNNFLDKGNTAALQAEITNVLPQHKNRLKDTLMSISPYLTKETVLHLATSGLYNRNKLKEIIEENPNVVLDADFIDTLAMLNTPLTTNDLNAIKGGAKDKLKEPKRTFKRTKLEGKMAAEYQEMFFWANEVIYTYSNDTLGTDYDSLKVWILNKPDVSSQYELAELYWQQRRYQDALTLLQNIPNNYKLSSLDLANHSFYIQLQNILLKAYQQGRSEATLERQEVADLNVIASKKTGFASIQAGNILQFFYGINHSYYPVLPNIPTPRSSWIDTTTTQELTIVAPKLWGYPNPAINWMDIQYNLSQDNLNNENTANSQLVITSTAGQVIQSIELQGNKGVVQLNTSDWAGGIYFAVLFTNKTKGAVYKFVVRK